MTGTITISVLLAVHNRLELTKQCLDFLEASANRARAALSIYIYDAGSSDGTQAFFSMRDRRTVTYVRGSSDCFWAESMRRLMIAFWSELINSEYVLLLNNDTLLAPDAIEKMLALARSDKIVVGEVCDAVSGEHTYGSLVQRSWLRPLEFRRSRGGRPATFNGNCVLIGHSALARIGPLSSRYRHSLADLDYGLRASRLGVSIASTYEYLATCSRNPEGASWSNQHKSLSHRWREMQSPKGLPFSEWTYFCLHWAGIRGVPYMVVPYITLLIGRGIGGNRAKRA